MKVGHSPVFLSSLTPSHTAQFFPKDWSAGLNVTKWRKICLDCTSMSIVQIFALKSSPTSHFGCRVFLSFLFEQKTRRCCRLADRAKFFFLAGKWEPAMLEPLGAHSTFLVSVTLSQILCPETSSLFLLIRCHCGAQLCIICTAQLAYFWPSCWLRAYVWTIS
jgi:hypothetical protein